MRGIIAAAILLAATTAHAQVFNCTNERGQKIFSDRPCAAVGGEGRQVQRARTYEEVVDERTRAAEATAEKYERRYREATNEQAARQQEYERAMMSAPAPRHKGYAERLAERNAGVQSTLTGPNGNGRGMTRSQREQALSQASTPQARAEILRESQTVLPGARGLTASQRDTTQRVLEYERTGVLPPSTLPKNIAQNPPEPQAPPNQGPVDMKYCAGGFCHDNKGGVYHQHGNGTTMTGPNGQNCVRMGTIVECH